MNNKELYKTLQKEVYKIKYKCEECGGDGGFENDICTSCYGKGYIIPLEFGCEIIDSERRKWKFLDKVINRQKKFDSENRYVLMDDGRYGGENICSAYDEKNAPSNWEKDYENLGKLLSLQDIFYALGKKRYNNDIVLNLFIFNEKIEIIFVNSSTDILIEIDLSKSIQNQDEKTLKSLLELIKE